MQSNPNTRDKYDTRRTVRLPTQLVEELEALADERGVSLSSLLRSAMQAYLTGNQYEPDAMEQLYDKTAVAWIISTLNAKTNDALTQVLMWRSEDPEQRQRLWEGAARILQVEQPGIWKWLKEALARLQL